MSIVRVLFLIGLAIMIMKAETPEEMGSEMDDDNDELDDSSEDSNQEEDNNVRSQTSAKLIDVLEKRRKKEIEQYKRLKQDEDEEQAGSSYYSDEMEERSSWIIEHKDRLIIITIVTCVIGLTSLIGLKLYNLKKQVDEQNEQMMKYTTQMENIIEGADRLKFITWKDQKEGILFVENPAYRKKNIVDVPKAHILEKDVQKLDSEVEKHKADIEELRAKETRFLEEIERLREEYDKIKKEVLEEGAAIGYDDNVLREFN